MERSEQWYQKALEDEEACPGATLPVGVAPKPERFRGDLSLHAEEDPSKCPGDNHAIWRTVECGGVAGDGRDIVECSRCGQQRNVRCNFDEEFC